MLNSRPDSSATRVAAIARFYPWLLAGALIAAYIPVWRCGFIWDDDAHLTANATIVGPAGFAQIWTSAAANYFPLVLTNFWVQHAAWGLNPLPYHLVNVAMQLACGLLLWRVLERLRVPGAMIGAALWTLHPVQVDSVAWISELKNTQSCAFFLFAVLMFIRWLDAQKVQPKAAVDRWYMLAILGSVLAILSKASTVMIPAVLGLVWWWLRRRWEWRWTAWLTPFLALSIAASAWTVWEQQYHSGAIGSAWNQTRLERLVISGRVVWFYLGKLIWPAPLTFIYPRWTIDGTSVAAHLPQLAVVVVALTAWLKRATWGRPLFFSLGYFWLSLFPVLGFFSVYYFQYSYVADHFQHLASIGPLALIGAGCAWAFARWSIGPLAQAAIVAGLLGTLGTLTWHQIHDYKDEYSVWQTTLRDNPECWMAHNNLGALYRRDGHKEEAMTHYLAALAGGPNPASGEVHYNLGNLMLQAQRWPEAIAHYRDALESAPYSADAHMNLGIALFRSGSAPEAITHLETAVRLKPDSTKARENLAAAQAALMAK